MLVHHSGQDYDVAASAAAKEARSKFEAEIERGKQRALAVIDQVQTQVPLDRVVVGSKLAFFADNDTLKVELPDDAHTQESFHRNAIGQVAARVGIPMAFIDTLSPRRDDNGPWGLDLIAENFNRILKHGNGTKYLTRTVNSQIRGFLSDSYRRMDSRPILDSFIAAVQKQGGVPIEGYAMETKIAMKAALPLVFEPVPNEVMIFGAVLENSDFGNGALSLRTFVERLWCTNRAIANEDLRKVHLGARLSEDLQLSQRTYDLDTKTMASAVEDIVAANLSARNVNAYMNLIKAANEQKIDGWKAKDFLKKNLLKGEADAVLEAFNSPDIEMLPAGNSTWRMSNAVSWIANTKVEDEERKLQVMKVAGMVLEQAAIAA
jgi:hypothetical protein